MTIDPRFYTSFGPRPLSDILQNVAIEQPAGSLSETLIEDAASLASSKPGDIAFLGSRKNISDLDTARASACCVTEKDAHSVSEKGIIPLISASPRAHFARIVSNLFSEISQSVENSGDRKDTHHPTACISDTAEIAENVFIGPYTVIGPGVIIGEGSHIGSHCDIRCAILGTNVVIKPQTVIGGSGFGVTHDESGQFMIPHFGRVIIHDNVQIGSQCCIDRGQLDDTVIGNDTKIDNLVQIAHNVTMGSQGIIAGLVGISGSCQIGNRVMIGGSAGLKDHLTIGDNVQIAARSGVMHDIPSGEIWSGVPAQPIRDHMRMINAMRKLAAKPKKSN